MSFFPLVFFSGQFILMSMVISHQIPSNNKGNNAKSQHPNLCANVIFRSDTENNASII